jgi:hypothetical protein
LLLLLLLLSSPVAVQSSSLYAALGGTIRNNLLYWPFGFGVLWQTLGAFVDLLDCGPNERERRRRKKRFVFGGAELETQATLLAHTP